MKPFFLLALIFLISACAAPAAVPPTATLTPMMPTATLEPSPTATQPAPTEGVGTATPELLPADVLAVLKDQKYTMTDTNGDGQKDIVADNGDTLFRYVLEADRINGKEWQRMITFTLEGGDKMEMARFDTPEEAYDYMVKNDILWKATWGTKDLENTQEKSDFWLKKFHELAKTTEVGREFSGGIFLHNSSDSLVSHIMVYSLGDDTVIVFLTDEDNLQGIYVDKSVSTVIAGLH